MFGAQLQTVQGPPCRSDVTFRNAQVPHLKLALGFRVQANTRGECGAAPWETVRDPVAVLVALQVLLEAGAEVHQTARAGDELAGELERVLTEAEPASGYLSMLRAGREQREIARSAVEG